MISEAREVVGEDFDVALGDLQGGVHNMQRLLAAMLMLRFPDTDLLYDLAQALRLLVGSDSVEINVITDDQQITLVSDPSGTRVHITIPNEDSLCVLTTATDESLKVSDIAHDPLVSNHPVHRSVWGSWASVPIHVKGAAAGTVCALTKEARTWSDLDEELLNRTAVQIEKAVGDWVLENHQ